MFVVCTSVVVVVPVVVLSSSESVLVKFNILFFQAVCIMSYLRVFCEILLNCFHFHGSYMEVSILTTFFCLSLALLRILQCLKLHFSRRHLQCLSVNSHLMTRTN
jgi:hypothetical protein